MNAFFFTKIIISILELDIWMIDELLKYISLVNFHYYRFLIHVQANLAPKKSHDFHIGYNEY